MAYRSLFAGCRADAGLGPRRRLRHGAWHDGMGARHGLALAHDDSHVLFWALVIVCIIALVRRFMFKGGGFCCMPPGESALDILKKRYANGEIDKAEYDERKKALEEQ